MRLIRRPLFAVLACLIALMPSGAGVAQVNDAYDVFYTSNATKERNGKPGLYFVNVRTGLGNVVVTDGTRHTLLERGVLYQENETGVIKVVYPDGRTELHPALQTGGPKTTLSWITSPDHKRLAWSLTQVSGTTLISDLFVSDADGSNEKLVLHTSSTRGITTTPLALTNDGATLFYSRQAEPRLETRKEYRLFPPIGDVFQLDVASGKATDLPNASGCLCAAGFTQDGRQYARLEPTADQTGFDLRLWDLSIKVNTAITAPNITHRQAGYILLSRDGSLAVYTSARGVPPARNVPPERYVIVLVDVGRREQRIMNEPTVPKLRAVAFEPNNDAVLVVGVDTDGTYKLSLTDGTLLQVSAYTFLGTISN